MVPVIAGLALAVLVSVVAQHWLPYQQAFRTGLGVGGPVTAFGHRGWVAPTRLPVVVALLAVSGWVCPLLLGWLDRAL